MVRAGTGPAVILLHGFPEFWYSWRHQLVALARAGFSACAVDMRGYNLSDRPRGSASYTLDLLARDVAAVARHVGGERVDVVGHDFGGVVAWAFASGYPELLHRLVILNAPHLGRFAEVVRRPPQLFASWYILLFQVPGLAEKALTARNYRAIRTLFTSTRLLRESLTPADVELYVEAISRPGALTAALNYYRAMRRPLPRRLGRGARTDAETLVIWGERDRALTPGLLEGLEHYAPGLSVVRIPHASHWLQNEVPDEVSDSITEFLRRPSAAHWPPQR